MTLNPVAVALITAAMFLILRWVDQRSRPCAVLIGSGIAARIIIGIILFSISYYHLPIAENLQGGNGFWEVASDARTYYRSAMGAIQHGVHTVTWERGSPGFIILLSVWLRIVGHSPMAGFLLNAVAYTILAALIVFVFHPERQASRWPCLVTVFSFTFSPALLIHSSQPMKDELFLVVAGTALIGASRCLPALIGSAQQMGSTAAVLGFVLVAGGLFVAAGIRAYYALTMWSALAAVIAIGAFRQPVRRLLAYAAIAAVALTVWWGAYAKGAGPFMYQSLVTPSVLKTRGIVGLPSAVLSLLRDARDGFVHSPGATSLDGRREPTTDAGAGPHQRRSAAVASGLERREGEDQSPAATSAVRRIVVGLAALVVPISLVRALSIVSFTGGHGLLAIADIDTVFVDVTLVAIAIVVMRRFGYVKQNWAFALTCLLVGGMTAIATANVVTNYGTLFRLRLIMVMPVWLFCLAATDINRVADTGPARLESLTMNENPRVV